MLTLPGFEIYTSGITVYIFFYNLLLLFHNLLESIIFALATHIIHFHCYTGLRLMGVWIIPTFSFWIVLTMSMSAHNLPVHRSDSSSRTFQSGLLDCHVTAVWLIKSRFRSGRQFQLFPLCLHQPHSHQQPGSSHCSTPLPNPRVSQGSNSKSSV